ncbi:YggN family protein [Novilysobacter erysipheiresistens]|uniref:YggN family protein n=1 Tax=Novilysobacter erysipheiresistens TaxID=1749332 RepID=A0ABU7Z0K4_9GAMM
MNIRNVALALSLLLPIVAQAGEPTATGINAEVRQEMSDARKEVRAELAKAKLELATENLRIDNSLQFAGEDDDASDELPEAEITPQGDFLIEGKAQAIDAEQRRQLLAYRGQVVGIATTGIDIGQRAADAALDEVGDSSWVGLLFNAMSGRLERRVEQVVRQQVEPAVRGICRQLPAVRASQQQLAASLPQFRPYATLEAGDVEDCENLIQQEFALI